MKMGETHLVALCRQALEIVRLIQDVQTLERCLFPSLRSVDPSISENCITAALRRMGYSGDEMT